MNTFAKIIIFIILAFLLIGVKENVIDKIFKPEKIPTSRAEHVVEADIKKPEKETETAKEYATIYFLFIKDDGQNVFKKVPREIPPDTSKIKVAITELLKGPKADENSQKYYSEIPKGTKLLALKETENKVIIDLNSNFQYGGGADSLYSRVQQLIKTAIANCPNKEIYLYLDGKQADVIGGEGVMIKQPLSEHSLSDE